MSELRWNPTTDEWIITATHRQDRTFFPPPDFNPLAPTRPGGFPTEIPASTYEIVVFENKFPSLRRNPPEPAIVSNDFEPVRPAQGVCEVVCYTPQSDTELAKLPVQKIEQLIHVWADRYADLSAYPFVKYVFIFENKGREIGVTLAHPHGQIYAYPFVPPIPATELAAARKYQVQTGNNLYDHIIASEIQDGRRIVSENEHFMAIVPFYARYPYEVHIIAKVAKTAIADFDDAERNSLAVIMKTVMEKYNNLFSKSMPYIMLMHQRPSQGDVADHDSYRFHIEFYPPYRTADKLKYLAGSEAGANVFINDTLPEVTAKNLRELEPHL